MSGLSSRSPELIFNLPTHTPPKLFRRPLPPPHNPRPLPIPLRHLPPTTLPARRRQIWFPILTLLFLL